MVDAPRILEGITMLHDEPLSHYTFTKTGGPADLLAFPKDVAEVQALVEMARGAGYAVNGHRQRQQFNCA